MKVYHPWCYPVLKIKKYGSSRSVELFLSLKKKPGISGQPTIWPTAKPFRKGNYWWLGAAAPNMSAG
jgi:hypothetical protein